MAQQAVEVRETTECRMPTQKQADAFSEAVYKIRAEWASRPFAEEEKMALVDQVTGINQGIRNHPPFPQSSVIPLGPAPTRVDIDAFVEAAAKVRAGWIARGFTEEEILVDIDKVTGIRK